MSDRWIGGVEAAVIMGVHRNTITNSLKDPVKRAEWWGKEGEGWRIKPLSTRFQVARQRAEDIAAGRWPPKPPDGNPDGSSTPGVEG